MPEIVFLILKIIGIALLALLLIAFLLLLCVLFVPIRYKAKLQADMEHGKEDGIVDTSVTVSWLLMIKVFAEYQTKARIRLKVLGIPVFDSWKQKKKSSEKTAEKKAKQPTKTAEKKAKQSAKTAEQSAKTAEQSAKTKTDTTDPQTENQKQTYATSDFCDKLKKIKEKKDAIINLWNDEQTIQCKNLAVQEFLYILKHMKPDKIKGYLHFGFEDPALTGYGMALYGMMIPVWGDFLHVEPEFDKQVLQGNIWIKGKLRTVHFIKSGLKLFLSKDIRKLITQVKALK